MKKQEQETINTMRLQGKSPAEIAWALGISVNTVRSHIRRHPELEGGKPCKNCGKPIIALPGRKEKLFCSDKCRMAWWNSHREQFQRLLADCRSGKIDYIVTKSISRLARNTVTLLEPVRELKAMGISIYFEEQNIDTSTADGELMLSILASYAQEESLSNSENMKWRIHSNFQNGLAWNPTLLGYHYDHGSYTIEPTETETVRLIFDSYLEGMGATAIAKMLNDSTAVSRFGNGWGQRSIMQILQNYTYTGNLMLQKTFSENHLSQKKRYNQGELPMYHIQDSHEAIIPMEQFRAVQEEIRIRSEKHSKQHRNKGQYPFSGILVCGNCGKHYVRKTTATGAVWICPTYSTKGKAACPSKRIPENTLIAATLEVVGTLDALDGKITAVRVEKDNTLAFCFYDSGEKCSTPHLREEVLKERFLEALARYMDDPDERIEGLRYVQKAMTDTTFVDADLEEAGQKMELLSGMIRHSNGTGIPAAVRRTDPAV